MAEATCPLCARSFSTQRGLASHVSRIHGMKLPCSVEGCDRPRRRYGMCDMHSRRWKSNGHTSRMTTEEALWRLIDKREDGCWIWLGSREKFGYGKIKRGGRSIMAHRYVYELMVEPVPDGMVIDHRCRQPSCVNPQHLEPVTQRENLLRGDTFQARNAAKTECIHGHPFDEANTYRPPGRPDHRFCRECRRLQALARSREQRSTA